MCGIDFDAKTFKSMDESVYKKIIDEIAPYRDEIQKLMLYLDNEPLLDKKLIDKIKYAKVKGINLVNISTNASLLDEEKAKQLIESELDEIYLSIDSLNAAKFEHIRKGLNYNQVISNAVEFIGIRNRMKSQMKIRVQMIDQGHENIDEFVIFWKKHLNLKGIDEVVIQKLHNWGGQLSHELAKEKSVNSPCLSPFGTMVIHSNGDVPLCCVDHLTKIKIGNVIENSIQEIWNNEIFSSIRTKHLNKERAQIDMCKICDTWQPEKNQVFKL